MYVLNVATVNPDSFIVSKLFAQLKCLLGKFNGSRLVASPKIGRAETAQRPWSVRGNSVAGQSPSALQNGMGSKGGHSGMALSEG